MKVESNKEEKINTVLKNEPPVQRIKPGQKVDDVGIGSDASSMDFAGFFFCFLPWLPELVAGVSQSKVNMGPNSQAGPCFRQASCTLVPPVLRSTRRTRHRRHRLTTLSFCCDQLVPHAPPHVDVSSCPLQLDIWISGIKMHIYHGI